MLKDFVLERISYVHKNIADAFNNVYFFVVMFRLLKEQVLHLALAKLNFIFKMRQFNKRRVSVDINKADLF